ncbi:MAG: energy-coupling factor ABC transporter ATP-binding protein [Bryobacterales bacterium]|jgi:cobalt/nickel transport system ATP-binding protein|nr:energy-coupling factor ABC transporter ATP-binding protein [Bryobacterales bacterium]
MLSINELQYAYAGAQPALRGATLQVRAGGRLALLGASGAGKSTLLLHTNGVLLPQSGQVMVGGIQVAKETLRQVRQQVGLVFQDPDDQLFHLTVGEDVAFGPRNFGLSEDAVQQRVREALAAMRLDGFEERINQQLSFGERRRASLATVLAMRPALLVLDEPFANLDPQMVQSLIELLRAFPGTVLLASQDIVPALACCDEAAVMEKGRVAAQGSVREVAGDRDLLRRCGVDFWYLAEILDGLR